MFKWRNFLLEYNDLLDSKKVCIDVLIEFLTPNYKNVSFWWNLCFLYLFSIDIDRRNDKTEQKLNSSNKFERKWNLEGFLSDLEINKFWNIGILGKVRFPVSANPTILKTDNLLVS